MAWRAMPRCNNMSLRRTKSKVAMTLARHFRNTGAYLSRGFFVSPYAGLAPTVEALTFKVKPPLGCFRAHPKELEFQTLLATAHALADKAGAVILPHFRTDGAVDHKGGDLFDPVTKADRDAETAIRVGLAQAYPSHGILGEEFGATATDAEYCWIIDPIDGTRAFILGLPIWGTLIGLTRAGSPLLGLMDQPFTRERFWSGETGVLLRP